MTPKEKAEEKAKEKAKELVGKILKTNEEFFYQINEICDLKAAKQCALIAVEFARDQFHNYCCAEIDTVGSPDDHFDVLKQEIEKL